MEQVMIQGLDGEGPGDILGAITHQADVDGEMVGDIDIRGSYAVVEIDANLVELVISKMDDNYIGHSRVSVKRFDQHDPEEMEAIADYVEEYKILVELEREEAMRHHENEITELSGYQREDRGRAVMEMRGQDAGETLGGVQVKFLKQSKGTELPETEISVGDRVMVSKQDPLSEDTPTGTVTQITNYSITVVFETEPPEFVFREGLRIDLYVNDVVFQRMLDALETCHHASGRLVRLRNIISGQETPQPVEEELSCKDETLNTSQQEAVRRAMAAADFFLIHGPPGTGKTTTLIEVIRQAIDAGESVLATAASNTAVDTVVSFLADQDIDVVRVGHPARVTDRLHEQTLTSRIKSNERYQEAESVREEAFELKERQDELTAPSGKYRRGMSNERITKLADEESTARGVPAEKIQEMAEFLEVDDEIDQLFEKAEQLEQEAIQEELLAADVVCTTNASAGRDMFAEMEFDRLVIDEATQATEPSCLIPLVMADMVVMAGDHRQLPPTVRSQEATHRGLKQSLFEKLADRHGESIKAMLTTQYRMHERIMAFPNKEFYDGQLVADEIVATHTLADIGVEVQQLPSPMDSIIDPSEPVVFVDTKETDTAERTRKGSTSKENIEEAEIVSSITDACLDVDVQADSIAVIAPYQDQVDRLRSMIADDIEVQTVDGFQGREKAVVVLSLTRSNEAGQIGFLDNIRRLNVSLTRARRKVIVIGDGSTISNHPVYDRYRSFVHDNGRYLVW